MCVWEGDITFSPTVLPHIPWPHRDITVGKYKAGFHEAWAYLGSESMWDMPRNKRPSLSLGAGQGDLFQQPQIALCFLNWQTLATFDRNDMQLAGSPGLPGRPPFSRKIVLDLVHQNVWWRSLSLRHKHIVRWWVQLTVGCTCVGKVGYFRVWGRLSKVLNCTTSGEKCQQPLLVYKCSHHLVKHPPLGAYYYSILDRLYLRLSFYGPLSHCTQYLHACCLT